MTTDQMTYLLTTAVEELRERGGYGSFLGSGDYQEADKVAEAICENELSQEEMVLVATGYLVGAALTTYQEAAEQADYIVERFCCS